MRPALERFEAAFRAEPEREWEVLTLDEHPGRHTCMWCRQRRRSGMVLTIGEQAWHSCAPCTDRVLGLERAAAPLAPSGA